MNFPLSRDNIVSTVILEFLHWVRLISARFDKDRKGKVRYERMNLNSGQL